MVWNDAQYLVNPLHQLTRPHDLLARNVGPLPSQPPPD
jgi:hypothetical protein